MNHKLPCEIVKDLFPSYIDGLTSDVTNTAVEEHIEECADCKNVLNAMKEATAEPVNEADKQEIDFLKKTRKKTKRIVMGSIVAVVLVLVVLIVRMFFVGSYIYSDSVACEVQVDGKHLTIEGVTADDSLGISSVEYMEQDGVVTVSFKAVKESPFHKGEFTSEYTAENEITRVCLDSRIVWEHGESISAITSAVYNTRHDYVGNMPENAKTARALNMTNYLGNYSNELYTSSEPYIWQLRLQDEIDISQKAAKENDMKSYAYILLAVIGNLGEVSYEYTVDGEVYALSITKEEATAFAGQDIKACGQDVVLLQKLIEKTGIDSYAYVRDDSNRHTQETIQIDIVNNTDESISSIGISYYLNGTLYGTQVVCNADETMMNKGDIVNFVFIPDDFGGEQWNGKKDITMQLCVYDKDNNAHDVELPFRISTEFGVIYSYTLLGNSQDGYEIEQ